MAGAERWAEVNISALNVITNDRGSTMCFVCCGGEVNIGGDG